MEKSKIIATILNYLLPVSMLIVLLFLLFLNVHLRNENNKYINQTEYINVTAIEYITVTEYINTSCPACSPCIKEECIQTYQNDYVGRLIREIKACEYKLAFLNRSDLINSFDNMNRSLIKCNDKLEKIEEILT